MSTHEVPEKGRLSVPSAVLVGEEQYRARRRTAADVNPGTTPVVGLALSGGGIRSATFSLGVLQELARRDFLKFVDYLSTVSGGGYMGACLTSLLSRKHMLKELDGETVSVDSHTTTTAGRNLAKTEDDYVWGQTDCHRGRDLLSQAMPLLHRSQIHHLRTHGDFLMTRAGAFTREMFRAIGHTCVGLLYTFSVFAVAILLLGFVELCFAKRLAVGDLWTTIRVVRWPASADMLRAVCGWWPLGVTCLAGFVFAIMAVAILSPLANQIRKRAKPNAGDTVQDKSERRLLVAFAVMSAVGLTLVTTAITEGGGWFAGSWPDRLTLSPARIVVDPYGIVPTVTIPGLSGLLLPLAFTLGMTVGVAISYGATGLWERWWTTSRRTLLDGTFGISVYYVFGAVLFAAIPIGAWYLNTNPVWTGLTTAASVLISRILIPIGRGADNIRKGPARITHLLRLVGIQVAIPVLLVLSLLLACMLLVRLITPDNAVLVGGGLAVFLGLMSFLVNFNKVSPHYFYRDRLAEAYLRTDVQASGLRTARDDSEMLLRCLHGRTEAGPRIEHPVPLDPTDPDPHLVHNPSPYHLVVCALNLAGTRDLARRTRKSDVFIFSRLFCGSSTTGWVSTARYRRGWTRFSRAVTISGAAASPAMGTYTSFATAFAMVLFNVRLGYWMLNPREYMDKAHQPDDRARTDPPNSNTPNTDDSDALPQGHPKNDHKEGWIFWPRLLWAEMFGTTSAETRYVNLSDGGHTGDNTGVYPLFQRRCDLIIVSDASRDPSGGCQDLAEAIRMIDVDENVKVDIDLKRLQPIIDGRYSHAHVAVGKIRYPQCPTRTTQEGRGKDGWLLYLKTSLTGDEPATVAAYVNGHPEFPHESTVDQFYDDAQFESYRGLGEHIAGDVFGSGGNVEDLIRCCSDLYEASIRPLDSRHGATVCE